MTAVYVSLMGAASVLLMWLVVTAKAPLPLLFETGLAVAALGAAAQGFALYQHESLSLKAGAVVGAGVVLMLYSYVRQARKWDRSHRFGSPQEIDGSSLRHPTGGRK